MAHSHLIIYALLLVLASWFSHTPVVALIHGVDSSALVPTATYTTALSEGFTRAVIRGYFEACSAGGAVDPNFVPAYKNAIAAGYTKIDTYFFPCTGSTHNCKPFATQISELGNTFVQNSMSIGTMWIDIETDPICNGWDYGPAGNVAKAMDLIAAARASGYVFGIYSSPGEWQTVFGSFDAVIANDVPLWFATFDNDDSSLTLKQPFGGWTTAVGKQYTDMSASGLFDLDIFAS